MQYHKHPVGLKVLFFIELWERFGFYTLQALLVLYLVKVFLLSDKKAYDLFSAFSALIYMTPVIGGYIADKFLGFRKAIIFGGFLYLIGYLGLTLPGNPYFYTALSFLIWGNGFFKSCVSSFLGKLYTHNDPRRDSGFTLFYMGINIGGFLAPLITTALMVKYGWSYAFGAAGLGMFFCLIACFLTFNRYFDNHGLPPVAEKLSRKIAGVLNLEYSLYIGLLFFIVLTGYLLQFNALVDHGLIAFSIAVILCLIAISFKYPGKQRQRLWALVLLIIFSIVFWAFYMQTFLSITLFIERNVDRHFWIWQIPTAMFQSIDPFFIICLSPIFAWLWLRLGRVGLNPSAPTKFALALLLLGLGFLFLSLGIHLSHGTYVAIFWVVILFFLQVCGELCLSPVGLSAVTELAPKNLTGMLMGVWFLALSGAYALAGQLADLTAIAEKTQTLAYTLPVYGHHFFIFGIAAAAAGLLLLMVSPKVKAMIK